MESQNGCSLERFGVPVIFMLTCTQQLQNQTHEHTGCENTDMYSSTPYDYKFLVI